MGNARNLGSLLNTNTTIQADDLNIGQFGNRNLIINGAMQVSQRGDYTTATSYTGGYYLDRWSTWLGGVTATVQHTTVTIDGVTKRAMRIVATSTASGYMGARQVIELQNIQVGATYIVSALVRSNNSNVRFRQNDFQAQDGDSPAFTNDGNWERVSWTIGTSNTVTNPAVGIIAYNGANVSITSGDYIEFTDFQLEVGDTATPFEHRSYGQELALCQRYYQVYPGTSAYFVGDGSNTGVIAGNIVFTTEMRAAPTASTFTISHINGGWSTTGRYFSGISSKHAHSVGYTGVNQLPIDQVGRNQDAITFDAEL